jgi:alpha-tubulin suppressor-like RCC1 family protein
VLVATSAQASALTVGRRHACVLDTYRLAYCWGFNVDGETGTGSAGVQAPMIVGPKLVMGDHRFRSLSAGVGVTCGVRMDGVLLCWGSNIDGVAGSGAKDQCGDVAVVRCSTVPVPVDSSPRWTRVSTGTRHACAVDADGAAHCWGTNDVGQTGSYNARRPIVNAPIRVAIANARITSVHSGGIHTCAITDQRKLYCWGADAWTFADPRHYADELVPRQPIPGALFSAVSTGQLHVCALETSGRARCWGDTILGAFGIR